MTRPKSGNVLPVLGIAVVAILGFIAFAIPLLDYIRVWWGIVFW